MTDSIVNLAINGGNKTCSKPFPTWPIFAQDEIEAVQTVLQSGKVNYWTGQEVHLFEEEFKNIIGTTYAVALANGSVALETALYALEIKKDDEVIVTPRSFIASVSSIVLRGATPVFADIDPVSQNITAESISKVITSKTRAIVLVHLAGWPCKMDEIMDLARQNDLYVVEDCAQALGAEYKGKPVGSFGNIAVFSFCQDKIITTGGEGGMLVTNDHLLWNKVWSYKDHGKNYEKIGINSDIFQFVHDSFGTNLRMTEMQAVIGHLQLNKLNNWINIRRRNASFLNQTLSELPIFRTTIPGSSVVHVYYKFYFFINTEFLLNGWTRDKIISAINAEGMPCFTGACPEIYKEKAFDNYNPDQYKSLPNAKMLGETSIMLMVHPTIGAEDINDMCDVLKKISLALSR